jgi:hypothetical protein
MEAQKERMKVRAAACVRKARQSAVAMAMESHVRQIVGASFDALVSDIAVGFVLHGARTDAGWFKRVMRRHKVGASEEARLRQQLGTHAEKMSSSLVP